MPQQQKRANVPEYVKNLRHSASYAAKKVVASQMPALNNTIVSNMSSVNDVVSFIRKSRTPIRKTELVNKTQGVFRDLKGKLNDIKEDVRTGKFYNPDREKAMSEKVLASMGIDMDFDDMTYDDDFFESQDEDSEFSQPSSDSSSEKAIRDMMTISEVGQSSRTKELADSISNVTLSSSQYIGDLTISAHNQIMTVTAQHHAEKMAVLKNIQSIGMSALEFNNKVIVDHINNSNQYYEDSLMELREINALLKESTEINRNMYYGRNKDQGFGRTSLLDVLGSRGEVNLSEYIKVIKNNFSQTLPMGLSPDQLKTMGIASMSNPFGFVVDLMVKGLLPDSTKKSISDLDRSVSGLFSSFVLKMNQLSKSDNMVYSTIGKLLGIDMHSQTKPDLALFRKEGINLDVETRKAKAITEVIPAYLAKLVALQTGEEHIYNYTTGKFATRKAVRDEYNERIKSAHESELFETKDGLMRSMSAYNIKDQSLKDTINRDMQSYLKYMVQSGEFYNPRENVNYDRLNQKGMRLEGGQKSLDLLNAAFLSMPKSVQAAVPREVVRAVDTTRRTMQEISKDLQDSGASAAFNEFELSQNQLRGSNRRRSSGSTTQPTPKISTPSTDVTYRADGSVDISSLKDLPEMSQMIETMRSVTESGVEVLRDKTDADKHREKFEQSAVGQGVKAAKDYSTLMRDRVLKYMQRPGAIIGDIFNGVNKTIYSILYGDEDPMSGKMGITSKIGESLATVFNNGFTYVKDSILKPMKDRFLGEGEESENRKELFNSVLKFLPKGLVGGLLGGVGLSLIGIPGGSILGPFLGAGIAFANHSEKFREFLFGKQDEDGNRDDSGLMPPEFLDKFKKYLPKAGKGAAVGLLGSMVFGLNPAVGSVLGSTVNVIGNLDSVQDMLFGKKDSEGNRDPATAKIPKNVQDAIKKYVPVAWKGISIGAVTGLLTGTGPLIGAITGAFGQMLLQSDKFKNFLWGKEDDEDDKRKGGAVGWIRDFFRDEIFDPFKRWVRRSKDNVANWFKEAISGPLEAAKEPMRVAWEKMSKTMQDAWSNSIGKIFEESVGMPLKELIKTKVTDPMKNVLNKFFTGIGRAIGKILSAPIKGITAIAKSIAYGKDGEPPAETDEEKLFRTGTDSAIQEVKDDVKQADVLKHQKTSMTDKLGLELYKALHTGGITSPVGLPTSHINEHMYRPNDVAKKEIMNQYGPLMSTVPMGAAIPIMTTVPHPIQNQTVQPNVKTDSTHKEVISSRNEEDSKNITKIEAHTRAIKDEVSGQLDGVGWNIEYIKNILMDSFGEASEDPSGERKSRGNRKRRGFFGKMLNFISSPFKGLGNMISDLLSGTKIGKGISGLGRGIMNILSLPFKGIKALGDTINAISSTIGLFATTLKTSLEVLGTSVIETIKAGGQILLGAGKAIGETVWGIGTLLKESFTGLGGLIGAGLRGVGHILGFGADTLGFMFKGLREGLKGVGKLLFKPFAAVTDRIKKIRDRRDKKNAQKVYVVGGEIDTVKVVNKVLSKIAPSTISADPESQHAEGEEKKSKWSRFGRIFSKMKRDVGGENTEKQMGELKKDMKNVSNPVEFAQLQAKMGYMQTVSSMNASGDISESKRGLLGSMFDSLFGKDGLSGWVGGALGGLMAAKIKPILAGVAKKLGLTKLGGMAATKGGLSLAMAFKGLTFAKLLPLLTLSGMTYSFVDMLMHNDPERDPNSHIITQSLNRFFHRDDKLYDEMKDLSYGDFFKQELKNMSQNLSNTFSGFFRDLFSSIRNSWNDSGGNILKFLFSTYDPSGCGEDKNSIPRNIGGPSSAFDSLEQLSSLGNTVKAGLGLDDIMGNLKNLLTGKGIEEVENGRSYSDYRDSSTSTSSYWPSDVALKNNIMTNNVKYFNPFASGRMTSPYGYRASFNSFHHGTDFCIGYGSDVRSMTGGIVTFAGLDPATRKNPNRGFGNFVIIKGDDGREYIYAHMKDDHRFEGMVGRRVNPGDVIGRQGNTGHSTGPHVHFEIRENGKRIDSTSEMRRLFGEDMKGEIKAPAVTRPRDDLSSMIETISAQHGLDSRFVKAVIGAESSFNPNATSPVGAMGLMQLMPATAEMLGVANPYDPRQNVDAGVRYLRKMLDRHDGNVELALAAYNAGPGNVAKYQGVPPFQETQNYINKILSDYNGIGYAPMGNTNVGMKTPNIGGDVTGSSVKDGLRKAVDTLNEMKNKSVRHMVGGISGAANMTSEAILKVLIKISETLDRIEKSNDVIAEASVQTANRTGIVRQYGETPPSQPNPLFGDTERKPKSEIIDSITSGLVF